MNVFKSKLNVFKSKLRLVKGTRFVSFLFIGVSVLIAAGILWAANLYYNIDTGEVVVEEIERVTGIIRATTGLIVGGTATQSPSPGYVFEAVGQTRLATTTIDTTGQLRFSGSDTYAGFQAPSSYGTNTPRVYKLPQHGTSPPQPDYVLTWQSGDQLLWKAVSGVGAGDITAVGDCSSGDCFTSTGTSGTSLWFYDPQGKGQLTIADLTAARTYTLPNVSGTIALGTSTAGYVAYWTTTNTLAGEQYLSTSRGGTGKNTSAWSGMIKVVGGTWATTTGTANYAAYWSDANTVAAEQYLAVSRGGTGRGSWTQWGVLYANGATSLTNTAAGTQNYVLTGQGAAAPTWSAISSLVLATNGLSTTTDASNRLTLRLGGTLSETTTISLADYNMVFNMTGIGDFRVQNAGTDILVVSDDGRIYFKTYPLAEPGKEILREMIPILGFDLPVQTATTSYVKISRTIDNYPFSSPATGTTRVHRFVIRYTDNLPLASTTDWRVATTTGQTYSAFTLPGRNNSALDSGWATTTGSVAIPTDGTDWWLEVRSQEPYDTYRVKIFQIFLAAYDRIQ